MTTPTNSNTTSSTPIQNKRASERTQCGDDTANTSTAVKKKSEDCGAGTITHGGDTSTAVTKKRKVDTNTSTVVDIKYLPHDLIVGEILTRLPVPTLMTSVLVSKLWYTSIHNDHKHFTYSHFFQSKKRPELVFSLLNVSDWLLDESGQPRYRCDLFKLRTGYIYSQFENVQEIHMLRGGLINPDFSEMVGYCNGLPCVALVRQYSSAYIIMDANRQDFFYIFSPANVGKDTETRIICHGFGFDPLAKKYKLVSILRNPRKELIFLVFTLGSKSWRHVTAKSTLAHHGRPVLRIRVPTDSDKSGILCSSGGGGSGCLAWKIIATLGGAGANDIQRDNEMEMLLSFNLHDEKFQFIQLPPRITSDEHQRYFLVDYPHLLGFKGYPCIARVQKILGNGCDYRHRCRDGHQGISSGGCCCCCKVHLQVLKDNVKQVWVKEESFDVRINSSPKCFGSVGHLAPDPCCFCCATHPTRIFSYSDQMLLYWFNEEHLQIYNLRSEKLQLIMPVSFAEKDAFRSKFKEPRHMSVSVSSDGDNCFSSMDYQLHCHEENFLSLQTFIPEGVEGVDAKDMSDSHWNRRENGRPCSAFAFISRGSRVYYPIYK